MFAENSRYAKQPTAEVPLSRDGATTTTLALTLRRLPVIAGGGHEVVENDRLDLLAHAHLGDATKFWRIGDANTTLDAAGELTGTVGDVIVIPSPS